VLHSATKFLGGHGDVIAGLLQRGRRRAAAHRARGDMQTGSDAARLPAPLRENDLCT